MRLTFAAAAFLAALPAFAAGPEPRALPGLADIPVEEWRTMAEGRTLTYTIGGEFWALERYVPGTDRVTLQFHDGACLEGRWDYVAPLYCFHWEGEGTSCFRHARLGPDILVLETRDGVETGAVQTMSAITDTPLTCGPEAIS